MAAALDHRGGLDTPQTVVRWCCVSNAAHPTQAWVKSLDKIVDHATLQSALIQFAIADLNVFWSSQPSTLSDTMYLLISFRNLTPPQNRQPNICTSNCKQ